MPAVKLFRLRHALMMSCAVIGAQVITSVAAPAYAQAAVREFAIPAQPVAEALRAFANATGRDVLFAPAIVAGKRSPGVKGALSETDALRALLAGTGLKFEVTSANGYAVLAVQAEGTPAGERQAQQEPSPGGSGQAASQGDEEEARTSPVEKVVVTGSRIRGAKKASPVVTITRDDIKAQGSTDLGQVARSLPQSFAGGQNPGVALGAGGVHNQNATNSSSINLRGIGHDATLTLLNGTRLPYDGFTQATDLAMIPIAAIERMEVLLDGASAIYGSDAVGGVANIILKRDYDGVEFAARWGAASDGGYEQQQYTAVGGTVWSTGGFIASVDYNRNSGVRAGDRDYITLPDNTSIYPPVKQTGALFSGHQQLGDFAEFAIDAFYTERKGTETLNLATTLFGVNFITTRDSTIWGVAPSLRFTLPGDWSLRVYGTMGQNEAGNHAQGFLANGTRISNTIACICNDAESAGVDAEGRLFDLPGGEARLAIGGGYRANEFAQITYSSNRRSGGDDSSQFVYGEVFLPLVSAEQNIPLVHRLSLEGAVRYEDYESFGETTTPKIGAIWGLTSDFDLKATWGKSFKVPTLYQQHVDTLIDLFDATQMGAGYSPGDGVLYLQGGNENLTPERAETISAGFIARPDFLPGFSLEANWFDVDYTERVVSPITNGFMALNNPAYVELITLNPTVAQQNAVFALAGLAPGSFSQGTPPPPLGPYSPARVVAILDARYANAASQKISGVDLLARYTFDLFGGSFTANANGSWLEIDRKLTSTTPAQPFSGGVFRPAEFRGRFGGTWSNDDWMIAATVNHTGGVINDVVPPFDKGDGWTTVDLVVDYTFQTGPFGGELEATLGVQNVLNEEPPLLSPLFNAYTNYDTTNYGSLGRVVNVTLTQRF